MRLKDMMLSKKVLPALVLFVCLFCAVTEAGAAKVGPVQCTGCAGKVDLNTLTCANNTDSTERVPDPERSGAAYLGLPEPYSFQKNQFAYDPSAETLSSSVTESDTGFLKCAQSSNSGFEQPSDATVDSMPVKALYVSARNNALWGDIPAAIKVKAGNDFAEDQMTLAKNSDLIQIAQQAYSNWAASSKTSARGNADISFYIPATATKPLFVAELANCGSKDIQGCSSSPGGDCSLVESTIYDVAHNVTAMQAGCCAYGSGTAVRICTIKSSDDASAQGQIQQALQQVLATTMPLGISANQIPNADTMGMQQKAGTQAIKNAGGATNIGLQAVANTITASQNANQTGQKAEALRSSLGNNAAMVGANQMPGANKAASNSIDNANAAVPRGSWTQGERHPSNFCGKTAKSRQNCPYKAAVLAAIRSEKAGKPFWNSDEWKKDVGASRSDADDYIPPRNGWAESFPSGWRTYVGAGPDMHLNRSEMDKAGFGWIIKQAHAEDTGSDGNNPWNNLDGIERTIALNVDGAVGGTKELANAGTAQEASSTIDGCGQSKEACEAFAAALVKQAIIMSAGKKDFASIDDRPVKKASFIPVRSDVDGLDAKSSEAYMAGVDSVEAEMRSEPSRRAISELLNNKGAGGGGGSAAADEFIKKALAAGTDPVADWYAGKRAVGQQRIKADCYGYKVREQAKPDVAQPAWVSKVCSQYSFMSEVQSCMMNPQVKTSKRAVLEGIVGNEKSDKELARQAMNGGPYGGGDCQGGASSRGTTKTAMGWDEDYDWAMKRIKWPKVWQPEVVAEVTGDPMERVIYRYALVERWFIQKNKPMLLTLSDWKKYAHYIKEEKELLALIFKQGEKEERLAKLEQEKQAKQKQVAKAELLKMLTAGGASAVIQTAITVGGSTVPMTVNVALTPDKLDQVAEQIASGKAFTGVPLLGQTIPVQISSAQPASNLAAPAAATAAAEPAPSDIIPAAAVSAEKPKSDRQSSLDGLGGSLKGLRDFGGFVVAAMQQTMTPAAAR